MYHFAVVALLALATVKLVDFLSDSVGSLHRMRSLLTFVFGIETRNHASGVWMTGFMVAGCTVAWRAMFAWLTHDRAEGDESLGVHGTLRRAA
jgi:hypothetical protein